MQTDSYKTWMENMKVWSEWLNRDRSGDPRGDIITMMYWGHPNEACSILERASLTLRKHVVA